MIPSQPLGIVSPGAFYPKEFEVSTPADNTPEETQEPEAEKRTRPTDPEILAMSRIIRIMEELDPKTCQRVSFWLRGRYEVQS